MHACMHAYIHSYIHTYINKWYTYIYIYICCNIHTHLTLRSTKNNDQSYKDSRFAVGGQHRSIVVNNVTMTENDCIHILMLNSGLQWCRLRWIMYMNFELAADQNLREGPGVLASCTFGYFVPSFVGLPGFPKRRLPGSHGAWGIWLFQQQIDKK